MIAVSDPDMLIAWLAVGGMATFFAWRFLVWVREAPVTPDPWNVETEKKLSEEEIQQACHHCSTPQKAGAWFCPHCGSAVGQYNNLMPYVNIFSEGEVYRNGLNQRFRNRPLIVTGFVLMTFMNPLLIPMLGVLLYRNLRDAEPQKTDRT